MKTIKAENYQPDQIEKFILDCKEEDRNSICQARGQDGVNLEVIWRMNFYRYWTEQYITFKRIFEKGGGTMAKFLTNETNS